MNCPCHVLRYFDDIAGACRGEESIGDTEWSEMLGTMKMAKNVTRVAAVLNDNL